MTKAFNRKKTKEELKQEFKIFMYNPATNAYMGRTPIRWGKLGLYYLLFFLFMATLSAGMFRVFYLTVPYTIPKLTGRHSRMGGTPGVSMHPIPTSDGLIFSSSNKNFWEKAKPFVRNLDNYLSKYSQPQNGSNAILCNDRTVLEKDQICKLDMTEVFPTNSPCTSKNSYGYYSGTPCVLLKVNKIYGWKPDLYKKDELPKDLPANRFFANKISMNCFGAKAHDQKNLGTVIYIPNEGIDIKYFPYYGQKQYRPPFVWAKFLNATRGTIVNVKCKFFAKNIQIRHRVDIRYAAFELSIE